MGSSVHDKIFFTDDKNENILVFGEGPTQGLDDTMLTEEAKYPIYFKDQEKDLY